jgi:four helix bundle protein
MKTNPAQVKSYSFALRIIKLYQFLCETKKEFVISKQILRSGTSIGANIEEALGGHSSRDFSAKISISYKEARETYYWLRLMHDSGFIDDKQFESIKEDCEELLRILGTIKKTYDDRNS